MRKQFLFFLLLSFLFSCSGKNKMPEGILPKKKMQEVMWDMTRAGEFLNGFVFSKDSSMDKAAESQKWYDKIYRIHKISEKDFDRSYAYYQDHPVLMKELMDSLSKKQVSAKEYYSKKYSSSSDSLKKVDTTPLDRARKRIVDTLSKRKKILKKSLSGQ